MWRQSKPQAASNLGSNALGFFRSDANDMFDAECLQRIQKFKEAHSRVVGGKHFVKQFSRTIQKLSDTIRICHDNLCRHTGSETSAMTLGKNQARLWSKLKRVHRYLTNKYGISVLDLHSQAVDINLLKSEIKKCFNELSRTRHSLEAEFNSAVLSSSKSRYSLHSCNATRASLQRRRSTFLLLSSDLDLDSSSAVSEQQHRSLHKLTTLPSINFFSRMVEFSEDRMKVGLDALLTEYELLEGLLVSRMHEEFRVVQQTFKSFYGDHVVCIRTFRSLMSRLDAELDLREFVENLQDENTPHKRRLHKDDRVDLVQNLGSDSLSAACSHFEVEIVFATQLINFFVVQMDAHVPFLSRAGASISESVKLLTSASCHFPELVASAKLLLFAIEKCIVLLDGAFLKCRSFFTELSAAVGDMRERHSNYMVHVTQARRLSDISKASYNKALAQHHKAQAAWDECREQLDKSLTKRSSLDATPPRALARLSASFMPNETRLHAKVIAAALERSKASQALTTAKDAKEKSDAANEQLLSDSMLSLQVSYNELVAMVKSACQEVLELQLDAFTQARRTIMVDLRHIHAAPPDISPPSRARACSEGSTRSLFNSLSNARDGA